MALEERLTFSENKNYFAPLGVYALGSAIDCASTYYGLASGKIEEVNPLINASIGQLGIFEGTLVPKLFMAGIIVISSAYLQVKRNADKTKVNPAPILYLGGILTAGVGFSWMLDHYFFS